MNDIVTNNNIIGPIGILFSRSQEHKKNNKEMYNMSARVPNIKIVTDDSVRPVVKLDNNIKIDDIDLVKDKIMDSNDAASVSSGSTVEATPIESKKHKLDLVEGLNAIDSAIFLAQSLNIEMPIVNAINDILTKKADINEVIKNLLTRPITNEF